MEEIPAIKENRRFHRFHLQFLQWLERRWDALCPLVLQRLIFLPRWNRRNNADFLKYLSSRRSRNSQECRSPFQAAVGRSGLPSKENNNYLNFGNDSNVKKALIGIFMVLFGFSTSSPHFILNFLGVLSCSMSLGMSLSLQSMETDRSNVTVRLNGSLFKSLNIVAVFIFGLLIGQLVGSSGGLLFLAEVVVTSISLVLGGMGTISASGMKSWGTFFCLSLTSLWGYLFGRCSVMENIQKKKCGMSSVMLCTLICLVGSLLLLISVGRGWDSVASLVIRRPLGTHDSGTNDSIPRYQPRELQ